MKKLDTLFIGLMLFSMFFGAGNLIFPPVLGSQSGTAFWFAMGGFILTAVGLPFAVLFAVSLVKDGATTIGNRVHPVFSTIFMVVVYLSIGPFLAIPRNANVAYEMGVKPFLLENWSDSVSLLVFSGVFFALVYVVSLNPSKMEKYMGRFITPVLLLSMVVLCTIGFMKLDAPLSAPTADYQSGAFSKGFIEGYNTMDALAALAFGIVILNSIKKKGITDRKQLTGFTLKAGVVAGVLLSLVYVSIGLIGGKMSGTSSYETGTDLLTAASTLLLGSNGKAFLGLIFTLACFTTVVGLTTACGQYFSNLMAKASYQSIVLAVTLIGFTLSNLGLNQILKFSVPFLVTAYPLTIVLIALTFFNRFFKNSKKVYGSTMLFTGIFAVIGGLKTFGLDLGHIETVRNFLPFASVGLDWVLPAFVGAGIGILLSEFEKKVESSKTVEIEGS
ncbi:branched-chain amino acid transport system II carrier protein [Bacillus sp. S/N-304-OC-R1]|uniref:branched-chain amino acid transport system II carrier protein n=1 Tax=Bacillus sp. S/N-304-OC-R1 TaxID=2758034 RepID=UPI001C8D3C22|nr:branched-chain amino acid transport system II carrier protein [Bacillus sp. S/N-304-OC-R1]MBY0121449.1 branched-chain amino acid transport system II carrier protein [Bacillus sp. S/N-304-OC-R1]